MAKVTVILGLAGSGKSYLADQWVREGKAKVKIDENLLSPDDCSQRQRLVRELLSGNDCVVAEIELCVEEKRQCFVGALRRIVSGVEIEWVCIENDLEKANRNCRSRPGKDPAAHVRINEHYSPRYRYPAGAEVRKMWPPDDCQRDAERSL